MKLPILNVDVVNKNNRLYSQEVVEKAVDEANKRAENRLLFVGSQMPPDGIFRLTDAVGIVKKLSINEGVVVADIDFFSTPNGAIAESGIESGDFHIRTSGRGTVTKRADGVCEIGDDYRIDSVFITYEPA